MKSFKSYLQEEKLTHLEHVEDAIFDHGVSGAQQALSLLDEIINSLGGNSTRSVNVQSKVDGAPAVIAGINPENGKFFVATKSLFNKTPLINYTKADINKNHPSGPNSKLQAALKHFPKMGLKGIYQGDFMYTPEDLKKETIDGTEYITFTPNTITYAVPTDSDLAKTILKSKAGIIWHTTYTGDTIADLSANFKVNMSGFTKQKDVWFTDTVFKDASGTATFTKSEMKDIRQLLKGASIELRKLDKKSMAKLFGKTPTAKMVKVYINSQIRKGEKYTNLRNAVAGFIDFVTAGYKKKIDKLKSEKGKNRKQAELDAMLKEFRSGKMPGTFAHTLEWHNAVVDIKMMIIKKLEKVNSIPAFIKTSTGYKVTGPEGFVAVDTLSNKAVKLVDRLEFSQANFNAIKSWGG